MKSRYVVQRGQRSITQGSAGGETTVYDYPNAYYDVLQVIQDYTGPKNTAVEHNHQFLTTRYVDYTGVISSSGPGTNYGFTNGVIAPFTRHSSPGGAFAPAYVMSTVYNSALDDLYSKLRGEVDLSVSAAEWRQTRGMMISQLDHLKPMAEKLSNQIPRALRWLLQFDPTQWPKRWLEFQYGWKPLLGDIYSTANEMRKMVTYGHIKVEGQAREKSYDNRTYDGPQFGSKERVSSETSQRVRIVAEFKLRPSALTSLSNFTSLNPVSIAWELMPYSFVVDWFYNVGGYLRNMESALLFSNSLVKAYSVEGYKSTFHGDLFGGGSPGIGQSIAVSGSAYAQYAFKRRTVNISITPRAPQLKAQLGWQRALSAASLLAVHLNVVKKPLFMGPT